MRRYSLILDDGTLCFAYVNHIIDIGDFVVAKTLCAQAQDYIEVDGFVMQIVGEENIEELK